MEWSPKESAPRYIVREDPRFKGAGGDVKNHSEWGLDPRKGEWVKERKWEEVSTPLGTYRPSSFFHFPSASKPPPPECGPSMSGGTLVPFSLIAPIPNHLYWLRQKEGGSGNDA